MDSHQRPLDFQSNALLLSYLNIRHDNACNSNTVTLINELKLRNTKVFGDWNAMPENARTPTMASENIMYAVFTLGNTPVTNIKFKKKIKIVSK